MSCTITDGLSIRCEEIVGGVKQVYISAGYVDQSGGSVSSGLISDVPNAQNYYTFQQKKEFASVTVTRTHSMESATTYDEQQCSFKFHGLSGAEYDALKGVTQGRFQVAVELYTGDLLLLGAANGMECTTLTMTSGTSMGDEVSCTMEMSGREPETFFMDVSSTAFGNSSNVTLDA